MNKEEKRKNASHFCDFFAFYFYFIHVVMTYLQSGRKYLKILNIKIMFLYGLGQIFILLKNTTFVNALKLR